MNAPGKVIVFAGGGSGGTIAPGIAVAERLEDLAPNVECVFLCSDRAIDASMLSWASMLYYPLPARIPGRSPVGVLRFVRAWRATRRMARPHLSSDAQVVALGGFVAPPVVAEARAHGLPVTLLNLDAVAGRANRWIAQRAEEILTSVACDLPGASEPIGVPLRNAVLAQRSPEESRSSLGLDPAQKTLLVTGASQGARSLNTFMVRYLQEHAQTLADWQVVHLTGSGTSRDELRAAYLKAGVVAQVLEFLDQMGDAWGAADLALSRGGASSLAEIAANKVPAVIAPYPWHADQHQVANAQHLLKIGGVTLVEDAISPSSNLVTIGETLQSLLQDSSQRDAMKRALEAQPPTDAALEIAHHLLGIT